MKHARPNSPANIARLFCCRNIVRRLLLQPQHRKEDILSLEEILAEGVEEEEEEDDQDAEAPALDSSSPVPRLCKARMKALQQAAYYSAEYGYLDVTLELREMGELMTSKCPSHVLTTFLWGCVSFIRFISTFIDKKSKQMMVYVHIDAMAAWDT